MKLKIGLFFGGRSVEHEISVISALQAYEAIDKNKYDVTPIYIAKDMRMYAGKDIADIKNYRDLPKLINRSTAVTVQAGGGIYRAGGGKYRDIDLAFPVVHGTNVEDGALQGYFQTLGIPYAGCDVISSAAGMDKSVMKHILRGAGVKTLDCVTVRFARYLREKEAAAAEIEARFGYPVIVKPVNLGSSVGIKTARDRTSLFAALDHAFMFAGTALAEPLVTELKEINCAVLGDADDASASECEEPVSSGEILGYSDKYESGGKVKGKAAVYGKTDGGKNGGMAGLKRKIPADITPETRERVREIAVRAFKALGCCGVSRIDFLLDKKDGEIYLNEINTIPGSLSFYLWKPVGIDYTELLDKIIGLTLKRERGKRALNFSFDTNVLSGL